jgi:hypothetical protein
MLQSIPITGAVLSLSDADGSAQPYLGSFAPRNDPQKSILGRAPMSNGRFLLQHCAESIIALSLSLQNKIPGTNRCNSTGRIRPRRYERLRKCPMKNCGVQGGAIYGLANGEYGTPPTFVPTRGGCAEWKRRHLGSRDRDPYSR